MKNIRTVHLLKPYGRSINPIYHAKNSNTDKESSDNLTGYGLYCRHLILAPQNCEIEHQSNCGKPRIDSNSIDKIDLKSSHLNSNQFEINVSKLDWFYRKKKGERDMSLMKSVILSHLPGINPSTCSERCKRKIRNIDLIHPFWERESSHFTGLNIIDRCSELFFLCACGLFFFLEGGGGV